MHTVKCPNCHRVLKLAAPVTQVKLRCRNCENVFVATSQDVKAPSSPAPAGKPAAAKPPAPRPSAPRPDTPPGSSEPPEDQLPPDFFTEMPSATATPTIAPATSMSTVWRKPPAANRSKTQAIIAIVGLVLIIPIFIGVIYLLTHKNYEGKWITNDEVKAILDEQERKKAGGAPTPVVLPPLATPTPAPTAGPVASDEPTPAPTLAAPEKKIQGIPPYEGDEKIHVEGIATVPQPAGGGFYVGLVRSDYDQAIGKLTVALRYFDEQANKIVEIGHVDVQNIAPHGHVYFSIRNDLDTAPDVKAKVTDVTPTADTIGFDVPTNDYSGAMDDTHTVFKVQGKVRNGLKDRIAAIKIYADFFTEEGVFLGTAEGELQKGVTDLMPNPDHKSGISGSATDFTVSFQTSAIPTKYSIRIIGMKKE